MKNSRRGYHRVATDGDDPDDHKEIIKLGVLLVRLKYQILQNNSDSYKIFLYRRFR